MFKDLLFEIKSFKYQITVKALLRKDKENGDIEFAPIYFNSTTKTVLNFDYNLAKFFQQILHRVDNWINEGSGWMIESIEAEYVNISIFSLLSANFYIDLPNKLKNSMKGLVNIKNNDNKCFLWWHIRYLHPLKTHPERITRADTKIVSDLLYMGIKFPVSKKILVELNRKITFALMYFVMKIVQLILSMYRIKKLKIVLTY